MIKHKPIEIGEVFGGYTVIKGPLLKDHKRHVHFLCRCKCGKEVLVRRSRLRSGNVGSCLQCKQYNMRKPKGHASMSHRYSQYKNRATKGKMLFELSLEEFSAIVSQVCIYCESSLKPYNVYVSRKGRVMGGMKTDHIEAAWISISGIDRIDSLLGYIKTNCVSCCSICNMMKSNLTTEEFFSHLDKIKVVRERKGKA